MRTPGQEERAIGRDLLALRHGLVTMPNVRPITPEILPILPPLAADLGRVLPPILTSIGRPSVLTSPILPILLFLSISTNAMDSFVTMA